MTTSEEQLAQQIFARALEVASDEGIPDNVIASVFIRIGLGLVGAARGGPHAIPDWLETVAEEMRANPAAGPTMN